MKINSNIYREIQTFDVSEFLRNYELDSMSEDERYAIIEQICALDQFGKPYDELSDEERDQLDLDHIIKVKVIDCDSLIFDALREWFGDYYNVAKGVRSGVYDGDNYRIYYGTGWNYDVTSDLLACDSDGTARKEFINFCNEDYEVMKQGGYAYLQSKGKESCAYDKLKVLCSECPQS